MAEAVRVLPGLALLFCAGQAPVDPGPPPPPPPDTLRAELVASGLSSPVYAVAPPGDARLFIVEQVGRVQVVQDSQLLATPFLDIRDSVGCCGERGLLSIAFHPRYAQNGYVFANYTGLDGHTRVRRFTLSADPNVLDRATEKSILFVNQPYANHNGGHILFGPDGMLYVAMGDGGSGGDPNRYGQSLGVLLGKLLRLDVDGGDPYAIPPDNPFVGQPGARGEIWAFGLRNPWRFAFDPAGGTLWIADVGQAAWEEMDAVPIAAPGINYGWNVMEGAHCYAAASCNQSGLTLPVLEYSHADGCSITGGFVYRGSRIPNLQGHYFYADYCDGWVRSVRPGAAPVSWAFGNLGTISSFGVDGAGELYIVAHGGSVYRIAP